MADTAPVRRARAYWAEQSIRVSKRGDRYQLVDANGTASAWLGLDDIDPVPVRHWACDAADHGLVCVWTCAHRTGVRGL